MMMKTKVEVLREALGSSSFSYLESMDNYKERILRAMEVYANQQVIGELEKFKNDEFSYAYGDEYVKGVDYAQHRVNELKQEKL
jgi:hypothetical protein